MANASCPNCGKPVRPGGKFCGNCGQTLSSTTSSPASTSSCPHCGKPVRQGAQFCSHCGETITQGEASIRSSQQPTVPAESKQTAPGAQAHSFFISTRDGFREARRPPSRICSGWSGYCSSSIPLSPMVGIVGNFSMCCNPWARLLHCESWRHPEQQYRHAHTDIHPSRYGNSGAAHGNPDATTNVNAHTRSADGNPAYHTHGYFSPRGDYTYHHYPSPSRKRDHR